MNIVIATDSFKGSLSSMEAGTAIAEGIRRTDAHCHIQICPLADGGEGTVDALVQNLNGSLQYTTVTGPLGHPVNCVYGIVEKSKTAIIEMSAAAGITLLSKKDRNPLHTTTYGVGELINDAIQKGCRHFIVGIGGSATNDGGIGMLQALGYGLLDQQGKQVPFGAKGLELIAAITDAHVPTVLKECTFRIACDVTTILCGQNGCSAVFGPQKGATAAMIAQMDKGLSHYAALASQNYPKANPCQAGTGAAGGLGFSFLTFTNAVLESGVQIVMQETKLEKYIEKADLVITGEGLLDAQTSLGKVPIGVAKLAKKYKLPVIAFAGGVTNDAIDCTRNGIDAFFPILRNIISLEDAMNPQIAKANLSDTAEQVFRLLLALHPTNHSH